MAREIMGKLSMKTRLVEIDGDEMAHLMWEMVKKELLEPYVELARGTVYFDLGIKSRDATDDKITYDAADAIKQYDVGVKCATITADRERVKEFGLKKEYRSPNGTIREKLDGAIFRKPIRATNVQLLIPTWERPIEVARHGYGDVYANKEYRAEGPGKAYLVFIPEVGEEKRLLIHEFKEPGVIQGIHNLDSSIASFARLCFAYALHEHLNVRFGTKHTISKIYDSRFRDIFQEIFETEFKGEFEKGGLSYDYSLIDDTGSRIMKSEGGILWACKNYDGDFVSDVIAEVYGGLAMMTSVLISPNGQFEYEAAHGTVRQHYSKRLKNEKTSTNPTATIFTWTGAFRKRGELDNMPELIDFAGKLERATVETIENGLMTGDIAPRAGIPKEKALYTEDFLEAVGDSLKGKM